MGIKEKFWRAVGPPVSKEASRYKEIKKFAQTFKSINEQLLRRLEPYKNFGFVGENYQKLLEIKDSRLKTIKNFESQIRSILAISDLVNKEKQMWGPIVHIVDSRTKQLLKQPPEHILRTTILPNIEDIIREIKQQNTKLEELLKS